MAVIFDRIYKLGYGHFRPLPRPIDGEEPQAMDVKFVEVMPRICK